MYSNTIYIYIYITQETLAILYLTLLRIISLNRGIIYGMPEYITRGFRRDFKPSRIMAGRTSLDDSLVRLKLSTTDHQVTYHNNTGILLEPLILSPK